RSVSRIGRETASEVSLPRGASQDLIVRREPLNLSQRGDPQLGAGAAKLFADNSFFDDAATLIQLPDISIVGRALHLELHRFEAGKNRIPLFGISDRRQAGQIYQRIALAGDTLVELYQHLAEGRLLPAHLGDGARYVFDAIKIFHSERIRHALFRK